MDDPADKIPFLRAMTAWHVGSMPVLVITLLWLGPIVATIVALIIVPITLYLMTRAAWREVGRKYAIAHLALAVVLTPFVFLGPILVPFLVRSDLIKRRLATVQETCA